MNLIFKNQKTSFLIGCALICHLVLFSALATAQENNSPDTADVPAAAHQTTEAAQQATEAPDDNRQADRDQLLAMKDVVEKAMSNDDSIQLLREHVAADFSVVTFTSRQFDDFDVFVKEWDISREKFLNGGTFEVKLEPKPAIFSGDVAICFGDSTNVMVTGSGARYEFTSPWSATCRKENGQWKLVRAHSSIDPFSNPVLNANIKKYMWIVGGAAGVIGLLFGRMIGRRRNGESDKS